MAEGLVNQILAESYVAQSAGTKPSRVHPLAIEAMAEVGIDISKQRSKRLDELMGYDFDVVVTLCADAEEICPFFPGKEHMHQGFQDPASIDGDHDEVLAVFRRVRDEIRGWIEVTFGPR
ncbi:MAG: arsenate reductase ArsC [Methanomassiliicoccales archaeon]|nr:arsenate reductase ArsC [Methanomassiliicoccales archaeon]MDD1756932.1 arsenate reductase ArsC [Methanomassiliicoccales archaeon]